MADDRYGEPRGSSWSDRDRERGCSDAQRARPGWGSAEGRSALERDFDHGASGVRGCGQSGRPLGWSEANRGQGQRGPSLQGRNRQSESGQHFGYDEMSGMMGGFGNQRFASSQDDHYISWRNRQLEELDRDYRDYCREREQQFPQDFDSWRSSRGSSRPQTSEGGSAATGETGASSGSFIASGRDPSTAAAGSEPTPEPTESRQTRN